jgi:hypothetical protein
MGLRQPRSYLRRNKAETQDCREKHSAACSEAHERKIVGRALKCSGEIDGMASWWRIGPYYFDRSSSTYNQREVVR